MTRHTMILITLALGLLVAPLAAEAQQPGAARAMGLLLLPQEVRGPQDLEGAFALTAKARPDAAPRPGGCSHRDAPTTNR